ncbi:MAG: hypothetical protein NXH82_16915 [Rhodobacteraceae bacterium]|nr:hypothetical protein [Paracoccaceae bacterium]
MPPSGAARFSDYPESLFAAFRSECEGPEAQMIEVGRDTLECRRYMPPDLTAGVILRHNGTLDDLPRLVIRFSARPDRPGYLALTEYFLRVPQADGTTRKVSQDSARLHRRIQRVYRRAGGVPE